MLGTPLLGIRFRAHYRPCAFSKPGELGEQPEGRRESKIAPIDQEFIGKSEECRVVREAVKPQG